MSEEGRDLPAVTQRIAARALGNVDIENLLEFLKCHHEFLPDDMFNLRSRCYTYDRVALFLRCTVTRSRQLVLFVVVDATASSRIIRTLTKR